MSPLPAVGDSPVLHVAASFDLGGTQTQIKNLCTYPGAAFNHEAIEIFPEKNYLYRTHEAIHPEWYVAGTWWQQAAGRLVSEYRARSAQLVHIYKLYCDFRRERPAVVVGWGHEVAAVTFAAAAFARVPHIAFCIRTVNPQHYMLVAKAAERRLWRAHRAMTPMVARVIVNSTLLRHDHARWLGIPEDSIAVCANGIAVEAPSDAERRLGRSTVRSRYGIADDTVVVLNLGRFSDEKGQQLLVDANARLLSVPGLPRFAWLLFGDGPTLADVQRDAAARKMDNMIFGGRTDAVRDALSAADLFVMPSDFEGMPNAMMEAMAFGLPSVSTNMTGALDVARDGIEAIYCPPRDAAALAAQVERLLRDPGEARAMGEAAARRIKEFSVARSCESFDRAFAEMLPERRRG